MIYSVDIILLLISSSVKLTIPPPVLERLLVLDLLLLLQHPVLVRLDAALRVGQIRVHVKNKSLVLPTNTHYITTTDRYGVSIITRRMQIVLCGTNYGFFVRILRRGSAEETRLLDRSWRRVVRSLSGWNGVTRM